VLWAGALVLAAGLAMLAVGGPLTTPTIPGLEAVQAQQIPESDLGQPGQGSFTGVLRAEGVTAADPFFDKALTDQLEAIRQDKRVARVISPVDLPHPYGDAVISVDKTRARWR